MANFVRKNPSSNGSNVNDLFSKKNKISEANGKTSLLSPNKPRWKIIFGTLLLVLLVLGGAAAFYLTQISQDIRQQASGCIYWNGGAAVEGATDNRGGITQVCRGGIWVSPSAGSGSGSGSGGGGAACGGSQIYCAGCIQGCRAATQTCNAWIDQECQQQGCGGNGVIPASGEQCCSGLQQCANGRCAPSCGLDNNPICGGIREGSDCSNGGRWTCDSADSGHCEGGSFNQGQTAQGGTDSGSGTVTSQPDANHRVECYLNGTRVYANSAEACAAANGALTAVGTAAVTTQAVTQAANSVFLSTRTSTHTLACDLGGIRTYVASTATCINAGGSLVSQTSQNTVQGDVYLSLSECSAAASRTSASDECVRSGSGYVLNPISASQGGLFLSLGECSTAAARSSSLDECVRSGSGYVLREVTVTQVADTGVVTPEGVGNLGLPEGSVTSFPNQVDTPEGVGNLDGSEEVDISQAMRDSITTNRATTVANTLEDRQRQEAEAQREAARELFESRAVEQEAEEQTPLAQIITPIRTGVSVVTNVTRDVVDRTTNAVTNVYNGLLNILGISPEPEPQNQLFGG